MVEGLQNLGWAVLFILVGSIVGIGLVMLSAFVMPKFIDRMTPAIDEQKEIVRGNVAVAEYFGRIVAAGILGISIIIAAAILAGVLAALHGPAVVQAAS